MAAHGYKAPAGRYDESEPDMLINIIEGRTKFNPDFEYAEFPNSPTSYDQDFRKVTNADFLNAIDGAAWWLNKTLGPGKNFETICYIGPNDMRYNVFILGAVKAGYKMLLSSPRNSIAAHSHLFDLLECKTIIIPDPQPPSVTAILAAYPLRKLKAPTLAYLLDEKHPHYPYNKTFAEHRNDPLLAFHTSGSTGLPKPIIWSHDFVAAYIQQLHTPPPEGSSKVEPNEGETNPEARRVIFMLPPYHAANHLSTLVNALAVQSTWIYPIGGALPSARILADTLRATEADGALIPPPIAAELSKDPELLEFVCSKIKIIIYAGGDVPEIFGNPIAKKILFLNVYGSSEQGNIPQLQISEDYSPTEWKYIRFHPDAGIELRKIEEDMYELWIIRDPRLDYRQPVFKLYPELQEWNTGDIFSPHPTKPGMWKHRARADDIIVFLTGEKTNPVSMEQMVETHPEVKAALVVGAQRFQAALIIELQDKKPLSTTEKAEVIERIWPKIDEANQECPNHAKISKSHILLADPAKPFIRAGKGTVSRRPTNEAYAKEIDQLYADAEKQQFAQDMNGAELVPKDIESLSNLIRESIKTIVGLTKVEDSDNFFVLGMDSLQTLMLVRELKKHTAIIEIAPSTVYTNPSVQQLAKAIVDLSSQDRATAATVQKSHKEAIEEELAIHKLLIDELAHPAEKKHTILISGSTGGLGSYLLSTFLAREDVSHVYCLNREDDSEMLQRQLMKGRKLSTEFPSDRVTFVTADLSQPFFGVDSELYHTMLSTTTDIFLNAWAVNFNIPLASFKPLLLGVTNTVKFASQSPQSPSVLFVSSISSSLGYRGPEATIPEEIILDASAPAMGYGESKYTGERILDYAAKKLGVNAKVVRVGQMCGPIHTAGTWNKWEWLPTLVISSLHVGALPESIGAASDWIDWVPIDVMANILVELTFEEERGTRVNGDVVKAKATGHAAVFHPYNPHPTKWSLLLPALQETLQKYNTKPTPIEIIPFADWLQRVKDDSASNSGDLKLSMKRNPAIKLLNTYEGMLHGQAGKGFDTGKALAGAKNLREVDAIQPEWMVNWCNGWLAPEEEVKN